MSKLTTKLSLTCPCGAVMTMVHIKNDEVAYAAKDVLTHDWVTTHIPHLHEQAEVLPNGIPIPLVFGLKTDFGDLSANVSQIVSSESSATGAKELFKQFEDLSNKIREMFGHEDD